MYSNVAWNEVRCFGIFERAGMHFSQVLFIKCDLKAFAGHDIKSS